MKTNILLLILVNLCFYSFSQEYVPENEIKNISIKYIDSKLAKDDTTKFKIKSIKHQDYNFHKSYYIIDFQPTGHVLMSAYRYFEPVLSYSLEQNFEFDSDNFFLIAYNKIIDSLITNNIQDKKYSKKWDFLKSETLERKSAVDDYLIKTLWGQNTNNDTSAFEFKCGNEIDLNYGSYNKYSEENADCACGHCSAGCTVLALAQVIKYWEYPPYSEKRYYNYDLMSNELNRESSFEQIDETAHLIADCGNLSGVNYCSIVGDDCESSNTLEALKRSLKKDFGYSDEIEKIKMSQYDEINEWYAVLQEELNKGRPIIMAGHGDGGLTDYHTFICDGYSSTEIDKFHINTGNKKIAWYSIYNDTIYYFERMRILKNVYPKTQFECNSIVDLGQWYSENEDYLPMTDQPWAGTVISAATNYPESFRTVYNGQNVSMHAYNSIVLRRGFSVRQRGRFSARLVDCPEDNKQANNYQSENKQYLSNETVNNQSENKEFEYLRLEISPNPANSIVSVNYYIPQKTDFSLEIFDIFGQKVKDLDSGSKSYSQYNENYDISFLPNGVYFCVLKTNNGVVSKKIIKI